ncbi:hypothetical protein PQ610_06360 [Tardisphaera miroshnichenkoae]
MTAEDPKFRRFLRLTGLPAEKAEPVYRAYVGAGGDDVEALAELVDRVKSCDPALGLYLAKWGPSVLEDQATLNAVFAAYAYAKEKGISTIQKLPTQQKWTLSQLMPEASRWIARSVSGAPGTTVSSTIYLGSMKPLSLADAVPGLSPMAVDALKALEELGPIYEPDIARALMRLKLGFDYAWEETLSSLDDVNPEKDFSKELKELYLNPSRKYLGKDFYDWVIELCYSGRITYNSERNLLYVLTAFRDRFL